MYRTLPYLCILYARFEQRDQPKITAVKKKVGFYKLQTQSWLLCLCLSAAYLYEGWVDVQRPRHLVGLEYLKIWGLFSLNFGGKCCKISSQNLYQRPSIIFSHTQTRSISYVRLKVFV